MTNPLSGRSALVTGGTRGIGFAIAARLLADGAAVIVTGTRTDGVGPEGCEYRVADFGSRPALESFAEEVNRLDLDILVNNAAINKIASFAEIKPDDFDRILEINVRAAFRLCQAVVPGMRQRKWGRIVNIGSIFGKIGKELRGSYSTSKFALDGLTTALAAEVAADGVLANCISPGFIDTDLTRKILGDRGIEELVARVPIGRLGEAKEIAAFVAWLVGPENTYISGQNIAIDGGFTRV